MSEEERANALPGQADLSLQPVRNAAKGSAAPAIPDLELTRAAATSPLTALRQFTPARIALSRTGVSIRTKDLLDFAADHALARDAVHTSLDAHAIIEQLAAAQHESIQVHSAATDRATYLRRPDLGRKLDEASRDRLIQRPIANRPEIVFIIADGLSAIAPQRYAVAVVEATLARLGRLDSLEPWTIGRIIIAQQARVALGDEIGELLGAKMTVMLLGERPGLSSPDSLGIYLTYDPKPGRSDADRNCISNVREAGILPDQAAETLCYLLQRSRQLKLSGIALKDERATSLAESSTMGLGSPQKP